MQHEYNQMMQSIDERKQYQVGKIKMGTGDAWWPLFVQKALNEHLTKQPSASTHVEFGNHLGLMDSLINEQIEFFIGHEIVGTCAGKDHAIIPVMLGDAKVASLMADKLLAEGIYVTGFSFPVVPKGQARIRRQGKPIR